MLGDVLGGLLSSVIAFALQIGKFGKNVRGDKKIYARTFVMDLLLK